MDLTHIITLVISAALSVGVISAFVSKYATQAHKYIGLAHRAIAALDDVIGALEDGKISDDEVAAIRKDVEDFKAKL